MYISGKDNLGYINGDSPQPPKTNPSFRRWRTENAIVKGWLINSMDPSLITNFIRFPTAKHVWDSVATTYFDGTDTSQVYDLWRPVRGGSIEKYYNDLQGLWREIDFPVLTQWSVLLTYRNTTRFYRKIGFILSFMD